MDVRRVGEVLLRSHPSNLVSAVSRPSQQQFSRLAFNHRSHASRRIAESSRRTFSTSTTRPQQNAPEKDDPPAQQSAQQQQPSESSNQQQPIAKLRSILNNSPSIGGSAAGTARRPIGANNNEGGQRVAKSLFGFDSSKQPLWSSGNSLDDAAAMRAASQRQQQQPQTQSSKAALRQMLVGSGLDPRAGASGKRSGAWHFPPGSDSVVQTASQQTLMAPPEVAHLPRLGPAYGRTVPIENNDLVGALRRMDVRVNTNGIRKAYHAQRFHERPGLKRKRLASARWRNRFMQGFKAMVQTVKHLKRQGW
ncbi:hypothetical protein HDK90DRAFT_498796 [Phyllosticta capitalensis]|uniref:Ribosomal protein S21 n=1 Tax=Phyllosticta capitalensis TaxID=121624 RepID=A0ABR1Y9U7_9PEZI